MATKKTTDEKVDLIVKQMEVQAKLMNNLLTEFGHQRTDLKSLEANVKHLQKTMYEQFDSWDQKFFEFKSQIHDLIDNGFSSKAKEHDEAIEILNVRTTEIRANVEKLNNVVFPG